MMLVSGVVLMAATVILFTWAYAQHRRPVPARWTQYGFLSSGLVIITVAMFPGAIGALTMAISQPSEVMATLDARGVAIILISLVLMAVLAPRFLRQGRAGSATIAHFPQRSGGASMTKRKKAA